MTMFADLDPPFVPGFMDACHDFFSMVAPELHRDRDLTVINGDYTVPSRVAENLTIR